MHNNIMATGSRDRPPMLAPGRYPQWRLRFLRYVDTRPNGEALRKCILSSPYKPTTILVQAVEATDNSLAVAEHMTLETPTYMSPENKAHFLAEKEAIHLILTRIGDDIYSTIGACQTVQEMWETIERLQQGESLNIQDVKTNLFWEFGKFTSNDGESMESYYTRFYKLMNEITRNNLTVTTMQQYQNEVNELRAEKLARNANPLALVATAQVDRDPYYEKSRSHISSAPSSKPSIPSRSHTSNRHKGKEIAKPITPPSERASEEDSDPEQAQRDKDMQKNLALIAKYFKKIYKPTNNNLRTSSTPRTRMWIRLHSTRMTVSLDSLGIRGVNVATTRGKVGSTVVQQFGIQCFNCKEYGHFAKECRKPKRVKDSAYYKEKMLLCKQAEQAHYSYMAKIQEVPTADSGTDSEPLKQVQTDAGYNVFANDLQHSEQSESNDQNDVESDDERVALANLIANLKLDVDENKKIKNQLKKANTTLAQELKECKAILAEISKSLGESISVRDSCLVALQTKQSEFEKYKAFNDRTVDYDKLEHKLNEALRQLTHKDTVIREGLKTKAYELSVVKEKHDELMKQSLLTKSHYKDLFRAPTAHDMELLIQTCLMPLVIKTQSDSLKFVHELKQEMHADLKYVESIEKEIDELESDKAEFSNMYDEILQECVSEDAMCSYLMSLFGLDALAELQCMYLHKVKECDCLAQKLSNQTESVSKEVHSELLKHFAKLEKHSVFLELDLQKRKEQVKNETVWSEKASNVFRKEREQYIKIQDLKAQMQEKNIAISELKKLTEKGTRKSVDTKFDRPSVVRQPNAQRIPKPSVVGKPATFSDFLERRYFPKTKSVPKTNVSVGLSKPVTAQTLPQTTRQAVSNTNVLKPRMYRIDNRIAHIRAPQSPQTVRNTNPRVSTSTGVNHKPNVSRPQLKSNQSRDKVLPNNSQVKVKKTLEVHPRISSVSNIIKSVTACKDNLNSRTLNANVVCATCNKCLVDSNHFACVTKMLNDVHARTKKSIVVPISTRKPKSQANKSIATHHKKTVASKSTNQKPQSYFRIVQLILFIVDSGCTKHMTGNLKLLCNFVEKFLGTVRFGNDQFAPILGYGYLVQGNVAFRKSTCFVRDLQGNDLLVGNRGSDLYTISLQESTSSTPLCLMDKATPTQAWLWHRRLSHLNFDYINLLSKKDILICLPKLKYVKNQLCSSCELSKAKRSSSKSKDVPSSKGRLNLLHMDLCGLMRVASINGKKYILVIVDDYSRYTRTMFLHSKYKTSEVLKEFLTMIQRNLQALVIIVRTDRGTKFLIKTLNVFFKEEGIEHQTSTAQTSEQNGVVER
nr:hypothetical protein [Tanacetum cinerariifolium]